MRRMIIAAFALTGTAAGGWWMARPAATVGVVGSTAVARKGDFSIVIVEQGSFASKEAAKIQFKPEVFGEQLTIIKIVEAGSTVKKGDVLVEFDPAGLERVLALAETELQAADNDLVQVSQDLRIQEEQNKFDLEKARLDLDMDRRNLKKWEDLEGPKQLEEQEAKVREQEYALTEAETNLQAMQKMRDEDLVSEADVRKAKLALEKAARDLGFTKSTLKLLKEYDQPLRLKQLQDFVQKSESFLNGKSAAMDAVMAQKRSALLRCKNGREQKEEHLAKMKRDQAQLALEAPVDGMVLYGDPENPWERMKIAVGEKIWSNHPLITIPDLSAFTVKVSISEVDVNKVKPGMAAVVRPDALADVTFQATVKSVGTVASQGNWMNPDAAGKFEVVLDIKGVDPRIKPGMKCKAEIAVEAVKGVLFVPIDSVFERDGKNICHVLRGGLASDVPVKVGRSNSDVVEILEGLADADVVTLYDPHKE